MIDVADGKKFKKGKSMSRRMIEIIQGKTEEGLRYIIVEHSGIDPKVFIEELLTEYNLYLLGIDGPSLLSKKQAEELVKGFKSIGVFAETRDKFVYINAKEMSKILERDGLVYEGMAMILTKDSESTGLCISKLPSLVGFQKDRIRPEDSHILQENLGENAVFFCDDFSDCLMVMKSEEIFYRIVEKVEHVCEQLK